MFTRPNILDIEHQSFFKIARNNVGEEIQDVRYFLILSLSLKKTRGFYSK